jgi:hypothetical protein
MPEPSALPATPTHALAVYAESLAVGRRVVVIGDSSDALDERLLDLGARVVHVFDPDAARAAHRSTSAPRGVTVRAMPEGDFDVRDGAFDVALVPDLGVVADAAALVARVRRLVGAEGVALFGTSVAGGERSLDYYELYDAVALQFASVRMVGRLPFFGVALAELGDEGEAPDVSVDTQLVTSAEAPDAFVAVASQRDQRLAPYAIVQLPRPHGGAVSVAPEPRLDVALAEASVRAEVLEAQLDELRARSTREEAARGPRAEQADEALRAAESRAADAEARAGDEHVRAERLTHEVRTLEEELQRQRDRSFRITRDVEDEKKARTKAELELGMVRQSPELSIAKGRVGELEAALGAAQQLIARLQVRGAELEVVGVAGADAVEQVVALSAELERTREALAAARGAEEVAKRVAELEARRAAALEHELGHAGDATEHARFEEVLRDRAKTIHELERELSRRARMVQELVAALEAAPRGATGEDTSTATLVDELRMANEAAGRVEARRVEFERENADLRRKLDALALETARREGEVQTSAWRITELEQELAARPAANGAPAPEGPDTLALEAAATQIDVLKRALAQEHEARRLAEARAAERSSAT